jgi:cbb3-type cytochrome oxidase subunit 3
MFRDYFAQSDLLIWPMIGLIIFLASFIGVILYVFFGLRDRSKREYLARLPLDSDGGRTASETKGRTS